MGNKQSNIYDPKRVFTRKEIFELFPDKANDPSLPPSKYYKLYHEGNGYYVLRSHHFIDSNGDLQ